MLCGWAAYHPSRCGASLIYYLASKKMLRKLNFFFLLLLLLWQWQACLHFNSGLYRVCHFICEFSFIEIPQVYFMVCLARGSKMKLGFCEYKNYFLWKRKWSRNHFCLLHGFSHEGKLELFGNSRTTDALISTLILEHTVNIKIEELVQWADV